MAEEEQKTEESVKSVKSAVKETPKRKVDKPEGTKTKKKRKKLTRWHFPNALQCPRCRTHDTVATSTKGNKQYRVCRRGHCRYRYCVTGITERGTYERMQK